MGVENDPNIRNYKLRELYPKYYLFLGALAAISMSPNREWAKVYEERLREIMEEIVANGGTVHEDS